MNQHKTDTNLVFHAWNFPRWIGLLFIMSSLAVTQIASAQTSNPATIKFDHMKTGFILSGVHLQVQCESCHVQGVFKGTPRDCATCHMPGNRFGASAKPSQHISTIAPCSTCHRTSGWVPATFSHVGVAPGGCMSCHNGSMATSKPSGHIVTTESCDKCHRTTAWFPAGFNHAGVVPGTCRTCHGVTATGVPSGHIAILLTDSCDQCHSTTTWLGAGFNHVGVVPGTCATCHCVNATCVGGSATSRYPKTSGHVSIVNWPSCDICHNSTTTFSTAKVHGSSAAVSGLCNICHAHHNNSQSCDRCHTSTSNWSSGVN
jgi:hypothetical protein